MHDLKIINIFSCETFLDYFLSFIYASYFYTDIVH